MVVVQQGFGNVGVGVMAPTQKLDVAGTDSWRHKNAGAVAAMLVTPCGMQLVADSVAEECPVQLANQYFSEMDMVLAEGFSQAVCDKIEVLREACNPIARCLQESGLLALVTDMEQINSPLKTFHLSDINGIARYLMDMHQLPGGTA
jgi:molybdopterin-guanine dinucleotide biosynthesis protein B